MGPTLDAAGAAANPDPEQLVVELLPSDYFSVLDAIETNLLKRSWAS